MKTTRNLITAAIAACTFSSVANSAEKPWYLSITTNQADLSSIETQSSEQVAGVTRSIGIDTDDETGFGITLGRTLLTQESGNKLSVELSYSNSDHDLEELRFMNNVFSASDGRAEGSIETETILARAKYQFDLGLIKPYLGLGIGQTDLSVDALYGMSVGSATGSQPPFAAGSDSATALELRAGLEYQINDSFGAFIEYTSTDVDDVDFARRGGGPGGLATTTQSGDFDFDSINLGLNVRF